MREPEPRCDAPQAVRVTRPVTCAQLHVPEANLQARAARVRRAVMTREEQLGAISEVLRTESFAVFSFAGAGAGDPPYSSVMFFAETGPARLAFGTSPGTVKGPYLRTGNGACAQVDTRAAGLENMSQFARVTIQGRLRRVDAEPERTQLVEAYVAKLPNAKVFVARPGVEIFLLEPRFAVCAKGLFERFEIEFPAGAAPV